MDLSPPYAKKGEMKQAEDITAKKIATESATEALRGNPLIIIPYNLYYCGMDREQEKLALKLHIIKYLNLLHVTPEEITDDMPMFREGLGLDSIDSIEMVVMMEREYGLKIENPKDGREILQTINSMMDFIEKGRAAKAAEEKA